MKLTIEEKEILIKYIVDEKKPINFISKKTGRSPSFIRYYCRKYGLKIKKRKRIRTCKYCGEKFKTSNLAKKYCSDNCKKMHFYEKHNRKMVKLCKFCGKEFWVYTHKKSGSMYCSRECYVKDRFGEKNPLIVKINSNYYYNNYIYDIEGKLFKELRKLIESKYPNLLNEVFYHLII